MTSIRVSAMGSSLLALIVTLSPVAGATAPSVVSTPQAPPEGVIETTGTDEVKVELFGEEGKLSVTGKDGRVELPQGRYILSHWDVVRRDKQGRMWEAMFVPPQHQWFTVGATPVRMDFRPNLTAVTTGEMHGSTAALSTQYEAADATLKYLTVDGVRPPEPRLRVVDAKGRTVTNLSQKYACCFISRTTWATPRELRGSFRIVPAADFGPFPITGLKAATLTLTDFTASGAALRPARLGEEAPNFSLPRIGGTTNLSPFFLRGRPLILLFSCGCEPCQEVAHRLSYDHALTAQVETAVVVTNREAASADSVQRFREQSGYRGALIEDDGTVAAAYQALHCPKLWLVDATGVARWTGGGDGDSRPPAGLVSEALHQLATLAPGSAPGSTVH
jgi:peroxiredoxin